MQILITNDDGIHAPGIEGLARAFAEIGDVTVVGPEYEQSGVSHALTFLEPLFVNELPSELSNVRKFAINGTPSDCTKLGILELCETRPDLVVSGINGGLNLGINCIYSGTLAGAREAAIFGVPGFAVSIDVVRKGIHQPEHVERAAELSRTLITELMNFDRANGDYFNINFPIFALENNAERRVVPMETRRMDYRFEQGTDPAGRPYYWTAHSAKNIAHAELTDLTAIQKGFVTITPMTYDLTCPARLNKLEAFLA